jgi:hypothetical protein
MFEAIKAFHEALRTDSTLPFVALMALGGALLAALLGWVTDVSYKRKLEALSETVYPIVDFDFRPEVTGTGTPPKLFLRITDRGEFQLRNVEMGATEYTLQHRKVITQMSKFGGAALLTKQIGSRGGESKPFDLGEQMALLRLESLAHKQPSSPVPANERFYALRFTFLHGGKKRFCFYKVISASSPYLLVDETTSAWGYSGGAHLPIALAKDWIIAPRKLILDDQRTILWPDNAEEYIPNRKPRVEP